MMVSSNEGFHIGTRVDHSEKSRQGNIGEEEFIRMKRIQTKETFTHMY